MVGMGGIASPIHRKLTHCLISGSPPSLGGSRFGIARDNVTRTTPRKIQIVHAVGLNGGFQAKGKTDSMVDDSKVDDGGVGRGVMDNSERSDDDGGNGGGNFGHGRGRGGGGGGRRGRLSFEETDAETEKAVGSDSICDLVTGCIKEAINKDVCKKLKEGNCADPSQLSVEDDCNQELQICSGFLGPPNATAHQRLQMNACFQDSLCCQPCFCESWKRDNCYEYCPSNGCDWDSHSLLDAQALLSRREVSVRDTGDVENAIGGKCSG